MKPARASGLPLPGRSDLRCVVDDRRIFDKAETDSADLFEERRLMPVLQMPQRDDQSASLVVDRVAMTNIGNASERVLPEPDPGEHRAKVVYLHLCDTDFACGH